MSTNITIFIPIKLFFKTSYFLTVINNLSTNTVKNCELSPNESVIIRCILNERDEESVVMESEFWDRLKKKLSSYCVNPYPIDVLESDVLQMKIANNFLIRTEAKYIPFTQQNITNEDLSNIINANNKHMTLCINWKAVVSDNGRVVRGAVGQHFVQIDHLFES